MMTSRMLVVSASSINRSIPARAAAVRGAPNPNLDHAAEAVVDLAVQPASSKARYMISGLWLRIARDHTFGQSY